MRLASLLPILTIGATLAGIGGLTQPIAAEVLHIPMALVPGTDAQPGGPAHDFRIGIHEITNEAFARFLNDALLNPDSPRGAYLYHDTDSGDVFIHHRYEGGIGTEAPSEPLSTRIYHAAVGRIRYDAKQDEPYVIEAGFENHPVVGVSWFGAAKFCNWRTLSHGMPESARIYNEGPSPDDWYPVPTGPEKLPALPGYRLPTDGGLPGINPANEWLKAASRRPDDTDGNPVFGAIYGFGRQNLTARDANYLNNGDTPDNRTTPIGFFDGINPMHTGGPTQNTANGYGLYDLSGNVAEWMHDTEPASDVTCEPRFSAHGKSARPLSCHILEAATRGGHYFHVGVAPQFRNDTREMLPAASTFAFVGFRIAQSITPIPLETVTDDDALTSTGPVGGPYGRDEFIIELRNSADYTHDDFTIITTADWLDLHQDHDQSDSGMNRFLISKSAMSPPPLIPPHSAIQLRLTLNDNADDLLPGIHTATLTITDGISDITIEKTITLTLGEPLIIDGPDDTSWTGRYCDDFTDRSASFSVANTSAHAMPWLLQTDKDWLSVTTSDKQKTSGTLPGLMNDTPSTLHVLISPNDAANHLPVGRHLALVTLTNTMTNESSHHEFALDIQSLVKIEPANEKPDQPPTINIFWGDQLDPFEPVAFEVSLCDTCESECTLEYEVTTSAAWLTLEPNEQLLGELPEPGTPVEIAASINGSAGTLPPGQHDATVNLTIRDSGTTIDTHQRLVRLRVNDPIVIDPGQQIWNIGCNFDPENAPTHTVTLTNRHRLAEIGVTASASVPWLEMPNLIQVRPGAVGPVTITVTESALPLLGEHEATLTFLDTLTGHAQQVTITASFAGDFCVSPTTDSSAYGPFGGSVEPLLTVYRIQNDGMGSIEWTAASDQPWLTLNGQSSTDGLLDTGRHVNIVAEINQDKLPPIDPDTTSAVDTAAISFHNLSNEQTTTRAVIVHRTIPRFTLNEVTIPADAVQPNGPTYTYLMTRTHITNRHFVAFLNDALQHLDGPKGHHLFFDTTTGDVYINDTTLGATGTEPEHRTIRLFSPAIAGHTEFADGQYRVIDEPIDYTDHPVSGVSWYGAIKFANWLTLDQGLPPDMRCYHEDTDADLSAWRPAVVATTTWSSRDLTDAERSELVAIYRGYRLPMDDGYNNATPTSDAADDYNEWYKAGAWNHPENRNTTYGFGRDLLTGADANYRCSGDPFENPADCQLGSTTPAGFYDGSTYLHTTDPNHQSRDRKGAPAPPGHDHHSPFPTNKTANAFGLMDMTGNLHHWLNGRYAPSTNINRRTLRGGSWNDPHNSDTLRTDRRPLWATPHTLSNQIGFRLLRTPAPPTADANRDGLINPEDLVIIHFCHHGPAQTHPPGCQHIDFNADTHIDLRDIAELMNRFENP